MEHMNDGERTLIERPGVQGERVQEGAIIKTASFDYAEAFSRNIGWTTLAEQEKLRRSRVAIAGMGGVGGVHALTLARLGIGAFHMADFDGFEVGNFNRQVGAMVSTVGQPKVQVMASQVRDINPTAEVRAFDDGVNASNLDAFLEGVDVFVDGLDAFVIGTRRKVFARCRQKGIPVITAAPVGMGTAFLIFTPQSMSFERYCGFREGDTETDQLVDFMAGLLAVSSHRDYLVDATRLDLKAKKAPSTIVGCQLAAGVMGAQVVKLLLGRGPIKASPWIHHFDAYLSTWRSKRIRWGGAGPMQRLRRRLLRKWVQLPAQGSV